MKTLVTLSILMIMTRAMASPAVTYECIGHDLKNRHSVSFELTFSDHDREAGYTNQSITIKKIGYEELKKPIVFQMYEATKDNHCKKNEFGEIFLQNKFDMHPSSVEKLPGYEVEIKSDCPEAEFDLYAYCLFQ